MVANKWSWVDKVARLNLLQGKSVMVIGAKRDSMTLVPYVKLH